MSDKDEAADAPELIVSSPALLSPDGIKKSSGAHSPSSPSSSSSSSSSEETVTVPLSDRLAELAQSEADIAVLLSAAASALDALNPAVAVESTLQRRDKYALHAQTFLAQLEKVAVSIKRSIRGLEEAEVPIGGVSARWRPHEEKSYNRLVREFAELIQT